MAAAADIIQESVEAAGLVFERSKGFCLASSDGMGKALQAALGHGGVTLVTEVQARGGPLVGEANEEGKKRQGQEEAGFGCAVA